MDNSEHLFSKTIFKIEINWLWNGDESELTFCLNAENCKNDDQKYQYNHGLFELINGAVQATEENYDSVEGTSNKVKNQAFKTDTGMISVNPNGNGIINSTIYTYNEDGTKEPHVLVEQIQ